MYHVEKILKYDEKNTDKLNYIFHGVCKCDGTCERIHYDEFSLATEAAKLLTKIFKKGYLEIHEHFNTNLVLNDLQVKKRLNFLEEIYTDPFFQTMNTYDMYYKNGKWTDERIVLHKEMFNIFTNYYTFKNPPKMQHKAIILGGLIPDYSMKTLQTEANINIDDYIVFNKQDWIELISKFRGVDIPYGLTIAETYPLAEAESEYLLLTSLDNILPKGQNILLHFDFDSLENGEYLINLLKSFNYDVQLHFVSLNIEESKYFAFENYKFELNGHLEKNNIPGGVPFINTYFDDQVNYNGFLSKKEELFATLSSEVNSGENTNFLYTSEDNF